jgi:hypothetical protein
LTIGKLRDEAQSTRHWNVELLGFKPRVKKLSPPTSIPERPAFRGFQLDEPWLVPGYRRNLPHLRIEGATYFVTFRLADSIPETIARQWQEERHQWLRAHGIEPAWTEVDPQR